MTQFENKLVAHSISKSYDGKPILLDVSLEVNRGEIVGLFGPNGAGKTTLFSIIIGLIKTDRGQLFVRDHNITNLPVYLRSRLGISYLPQESSIFRGMTVRDNIKAILEVRCSDNQEVEQQLSSLMDEFSISHLQEKMASTLSGGERRRLEIARALATAPDFILLDEPLAGIDPIVVSDIKKLILHLKKRQIGVLITDHNVRDTLDVIDRGYIIYDGKIIMNSTPDQIIESAKVREVYLGNSF